MTDDVDDHERRAENGRAFVEFIRTLATEVDRLSVRVQAMQAVLDAHGIPTAEVDRESSKIEQDRRGQQLADWFDEPDLPTNVQ